jgi:hypothetical protein
VCWQWAAARVPVTVFLDSPLYVGREKSDEMAEEKLNREFTFRMTDAQANTLIVYSFWKGLGGCDEALRAMIDAADEFMLSKGVDMEDYAAAINEHMLSKKKSPT